MAVVGCFRSWKLPLISRKGIVYRLRLVSPLKGEHFRVALIWRLLWKRGQVARLGALMACVILVGCGGDSDNSPSPQPVGLDIPAVQGTVQVDIPAAAAIDPSVLTVTNGLVDEKALSATRETPLTFNSSAAQLVTASQGDTPILMAIVVTPSQGDRTTLSVESTAAALVYLQPFVAQTDPERARTVMDTIQTLQETQVLADVLRRKIEGGMTVLVADDTEIAEALEIAVAVTLQTIQGLLSKASEKVAVTPSDARSGLIVTTDSSDEIGSHTITIQNTFQRYVAAYLENSVGTDIGFKMIDGASSLYGFSITPATDFLTIDTAAHPNAVLRIYGPGIRNWDVWLNDPHRFDRMWEPVLMTGIFEVGAPIAITYLGVNYGIQGSALGSLGKNILENAYLELRHDTTIRQSIVQGFGETASDPTVLITHVLKKVAKMTVEAVVENRQNLARSALETAGVTDPQTYRLVDRMSSRMIRTVTHWFKTLPDGAIDVLEVMIDLGRSSPLEIYTVEDLRANQTLFGVDLTSRLFTFNIATKAVQIIGPLGGTSLDIARAPNGDLFAESFGALVTLDPTTGAASSIGALGYSAMNSLAFRADGTLFGATAQGEFVQIDTSTGAATLIGHFGSGLGAWGDLAFAPDGTLFGTTYFMDGSPSGIFLMRLNPTTGQADNIGPIGFSSVYGLAFTADGSLYGGDSDTGMILRIDPTTGAGTIFTITDLPSIAGLAS